MGNILISPDFALLWLKQSMTALCDALFTTTLIIWLGVSTNSPISVGLALGAMGAAYVLFGPFAEAATERWSRRKTMFVTDVVRSISTLLLTLALLPLLTPKRALALICLLCFVIGLMSRFSLAAQRSSLNAVVPPREHARGISRIQGSVALMTIIGPIFAAMLFLFPSMLFPPGTPLLGLLATGFLLLLSAGGAQAMDREFTAKVRAINLRRKSQALGPDGQPIDGEDDAQAEEEEEERWSPSVLRSGIANWVKGIRQVLQQPTFAPIARVAALVAFAGGILNVLEVFYVSDTLSRPGAFLGLLLAADAAGILLGSVLFRYLDGHLRPSTNFAYAVPALGLATMALVTTSSFGEALFWAGAMGVANGVMLLAAQTALVETEEYDKLPRLFVGYDTLTALLSLTGIIVGGLAAHTFKINTVLLVAGLLLTLSGVLGWLALSGMLKGSKKGQAAAPQPAEESEQADMEGYDEGMDGYEPTEEEGPAYDEAPEEEEAPAPAPRLTRQFGRPWAAQHMNNQMDDQDAGGYEEDEQPYDDGGYQEDANAWEPEQPIEEAPMPRPSLRLRPKPWEQPDRSGRTRR
jgi:MFS family permease